MSSIEILSGNAKLDEKLREWLDWDRNDATRDQVVRMIKEKKFDELAGVMLDRIQFGTAGLRGKMAPGYTCMNDLVIVQTAQGIVKYLEKHEPSLLTKYGIVVGFDGRHNSKKWAKITATVFTNAGYTVRLFSEVNPTPFIPFSVKLFNCAMGIMVTASHNPKEDNGYKVYASNGAQIVSPADKLIQESITANLVPLDSSWELEKTVYDKKILFDPLHKTTLDYINAFSAQMSPTYKELNRKMSLPFVYTAMHGVGYRYMAKVFDVVNLNILPVPEQRDPHPDFPTVKFPNPEEGKSSLELSFKFANEQKSKVVIANDPDADRMCFAEKSEDGKWRIFNGNEIGALLGWWMFHCYKEKHPRDNMKDVYMIASTVSSKILQTMAKAEGFNFIETLTGFKWIGNKADELVRKGKKMIFAFEEAIGSMCGPEVLDKDGISAGCQAATMISYLYSKGITIAGKLDNIYETYGHHITRNSYFICHDQEKIKKIFHRIRHLENNGYPTSLMDGKYKIASVRDLTTGYDNSQPDKKAILPVSSGSQMITFTFQNGFVCTLRTSGTEPKLKYYTELCAQPGAGDRDTLTGVLNEMVNELLDKFLEPTKNDLRPQGA